MITFPSFILQQGNSPVLAATLDRQYTHRTSVPVTFEMWPTTFHPPRSTASKVYFKDFKVSFPVETFVSRPASHLQFKQTSSSFLPSLNHFFFLFFRQANTRISDGDCYASGGITDHFLRLRIVFALAGGVNEVTLLADCLPFRCVPL